MSKTPNPIHDEFKKLIFNSTISTGENVCIPVNNINSQFHYLDLLLICNTVTPGATLKVKNKVDYSDDNFTTSAKYTSTDETRFFKSDNTSDVSALDQTELTEVGQMKAVRYSPDNLKYNDIKFYLEGSGTMRATVVAFKVAKNQPVNQ